MLQYQQIVIRSLKGHRSLIQFRTAASSTRQSIPYTVKAQDARRAFEAFHRSPLTSTPAIEQVQQKYAAYYLIHASAKAAYRASIGRSMNVPYRDPQTGRVMERQRIVWTTLQPQFTPLLRSEYSAADPQAQIYAGFEHYEEQMARFMPFDVAHFKPHMVSNIPEESFVMTEDFAKQKLRERITEHYLQIIKEALHRRHGAMIKIDQIEVDISVNSTLKGLYPLWIFKHTNSNSKSLVSGINAKVSSIRMYDPTLSGAIAGLTTTLVSFLLLHSVIFSFITFFLFSFLGRSAARYTPVWKTMRMEGRRTADILANQRFSGQDSQGFGGFNPFEGFSGAGSGPQGNPFNFDPFGSGGGFQGQRRASDPFYGSGYGRSSSESRSQQQNRSSPPQRSAQDLYKTLGVPRNASQEDITTAFRKLALSKHPDKVPAEQKAQASKDFSQINEAYRVLRSPGKRSQYDRYGVV